MTDLNVEGLVTVIVFYLIIIVVGIVANKFFGLTGDDDSAEMSMVAGRNLGLVIGIFTMAGQSSLKLHRKNIICAQLYHNQIWLLV